VALKRKLGRGLGEILGSSKDVEARRVLEVETSRIMPNRDQPRTEFNADKMRSLMDSIAKNGMLQPIIVRSVETGYEIIAGERRWKAAMQIGLEKIPVLVKEVSDEKLLELALIENIQREDLNPIERARAYKKLMDDFHLTQEQAASALGQERSTLANTIRLLDLDESIRKEIAKGVISVGHAKVLLSVQTKEQQLKLAKRIISEDLSVRATEEIASLSSKRPAKKTKVMRTAAAHIRAFEDRLRRALGTKVTIREASGRGKIIIEFYSNDDFDRIIESIGQGPA